MTAIYPVCSIWQGVLNTCGQVNAAAPSRNRSQISPTEDMQSQNYLKRNQTSKCVSQSDQETDNPNNQSQSCLFCHEAFGQEGGFIRQLLTRSDRPPTHITESLWMGSEWTWSLGIESRYWCPPSPHPTYVQSEPSVMPGQSRTSRCQQDSDLRTLGPPEVLWGLVPL